MAVLGGLRESAALERWQSSSFAYSTVQYCIVLAPSVSQALAVWCTRRRGKNSKVAMRAYPSRWRPVEKILSVRSHSRRQPRHETRCRSSGSSRASRGQTPVPLTSAPPGQGRGPRRDAGPGVPGVCSQRLCLCILECLGLCCPRKPWSAKEVSHLGAHHVCPPPFAAEMHANATHRHVGDFMAHCTATIDEPFPLRSGGQDGPKPWSCT